MKKNRHLNRTAHELAREFGDMESLIEVGKILVRKAILIRALEDPSDFVYTVGRYGGVMAECYLGERAFGRRRMSYSIFDDESDTYTEGYDEMLALNIAKKLEFRPALVDEIGNTCTYSLMLPKEEEQNG